jgi:tRNA (adenine22-N1)-methyltransferase
MKDRLALSPRLQKIASLVPEGSVVADVGTDHGYVPVWLLCSGVIRRALATESTGPAHRAAEGLREIRRG